MAKAKSKKPTKRQEGGTVKRGKSGASRSEPTSHRVRGRDKEYGQYYIDAPVKYIKEGATYAPEPTSRRTVTEKRAKGGSVKKARKVKR